MSPDLHSKLTWSNFTPQKPSTVANKDRTFSFHISVSIQWLLFLFITWKLYDTWVLMDLLFFPVAYLVLSSSPLLHYGLLQGRISILHALLEIARFHSCIWSSGACWEETFHAKCVFLVICRLFGIMLRDPVAGLKSTLIGNEFEKGLMMQALRGHVAPRTGGAMALGLSLHSHLSRRGFIWVWQQKKHMAHLWWHQCVLFKMVLWQFECSSEI